MDGSKNDEGAPSINPNWQQALDKVMHTSLMSKGMGTMSASGDEDGDDDGGNAKFVPSSSAAKSGRKISKKNDDSDSETLSDSDTLSQDEDDDDDIDDDISTEADDDDFPKTSKMPSGFGPQAGRFERLPPPSRDFAAPSAPPRPRPAPPVPAAAPLPPPSAAQEANMEAMKRRVEENRSLQKEEKYELLGRLQYFTDERGFKPFRVLGPEDSLEDIRYEVFRAQREMSKKRNVKMMQKALVTVGAGIEMMNSWYNPLNLRLDGFSKSLLLSIREYDEIFEELHWKYCDAVSMPPEMKLIMTLGSSLWFFHMSNHSTIPAADNGAPSQTPRPAQGSAASAVAPGPAAPAPSTGPGQASAAAAPPQRRMNGPRMQNAGPTIDSIFPAPAALRPAGGGGMGGMQPNAMDMTSLLSGLGMVQTLINSGSAF